MYICLSSCQSFCWAVYMSVELSVCLLSYSCLLSWLSACWAVYLSIELSICVLSILSVSLNVFLSVQLSIFILNCLSTCMSVQLSFYQLICLLSVFLSVELSIYLSVWLAVYLSIELYYVCSVVFLSGELFICFYLSICLHVCKTNVYIYSPGVESIMYRRIDIKPTTELKLNTTVGTFNILTKFIK